VCIGRNYAAHARRTWQRSPQRAADVFSSLLLRSSVRASQSLSLPILNASNMKASWPSSLAVAARIFAIPMMPCPSFSGIRVSTTSLARDIQKSDVQFTRGKGFDTFLPDWAAHRNRNSIQPMCSSRRAWNGAVRQSGNTSLMIYPCAFLVRWISRMMTLYPGDVIATGTPAGVGQVRRRRTLSKSVLAELECCVIRCMPHKRSSRLPPASVKLPCGISLPNEAGT